MQRKKKMKKNEKEKRENETYFIYTWKGLLKYSLNPDHSSSTSECLVHWSPIEFDTESKKGRK